MRGHRHVVGYLAVDSRIVVSTGLQDEQPIAVMSSVGIILSERQPVIHFSGSKKQAFYTRFKTGNWLSGKFTQRVVLCG